MEAISSHWSVTTRESIDPHSRSRLCRAKPENAATQQLAAAHEQLKEAHETIVELSGELARAAVSPTAQPARSQPALTDCSPQPQLTHTVAPAAAPLYASYVVDFALLAGGEPRVIELNPFDEQTGAGLFSWERDRDALQRAPPPGEPCPLRLATQPRPRMQPTLEVLLLELPRESARTATPRSIDTPGDTQITRDDRAAARTDRIALTSSGCQVL